MTAPVVVHKPIRRRCHARWWTGYMVEACVEDAEKGRKRCEAHQPDGSLLDKDGKPQAFAS